MAVHKSGEDYLEAILVIQEEKGNCRSIDVARHLGVSKPSVSVAMNLLREDQMITTDAEGLLHFTEAGRTLAEAIYRRHCLIRDFLIHIGVPVEVAKADACKMEHDVSEETVKCLEDFCHQFHLKRNAGKSE